MRMEPELLLQLEKLQQKLALAEAVAEDAATRRSPEARYPFVAGYLAGATSGAAAELRSILSLLRG